MYGSAGIGGNGNGAERGGSVGIDAGLAVDPDRASRPVVVGREVVVGDRPGRRDAALVLELAEVLRRSRGKAAP